MFSLLFLQSEGGLRTQQGRCAECGIRWWFYLCSRGEPEPVQYVDIYTRDVLPVLCAWHTVDVSRVWNSGTAPLGWGKRAAGDQKISLAPQQATRRGGKGGKTHF